MSTVAPGEIRAQPARRRRPSRPSRSRPCSPTSTACCCPASRTGTTRASSPTSASPRSQPGILAELLTADAERQRDALAHVAGRDRARAADALVARASCSTCRRPGTATSRTRPRPPRSPRSARRAARGPTAASSSPPSTRTRRSTAPAASSGSSSATSPVDDAFRMRVDALDLSDACAVVADRRHDLDDLGRSRAGDRRRGRGGGRLAAHRRGLRGLGARLPRAAHARASSAPTRSSSTRTSGCSRRSTARASSRRAPTTCARRSRSRPSTCARPPRASLNLNEYGPALGRRFRALKLWAVLRCYGRAGLQATIREHVRLAEQFEGWVRDEPGWELCAPRPVLGRLLPARGRRRAQRGAARGGQRERRGLPLAHAPERPARPAPRDRQRRDDRGRRAPGLGRAAARGRAPRRRRAGERLMRVLVLQHIACEPPGVFEDVLAASAGTSSCASSSTRASRCPTGAWDAIVAMGGPMSVNDEGEHPWLVAEKAAIASHVRAGRPFWGSCLGAQLLAAALGARVYAGPAPEVGVLAVELTEAGRADPVLGRAAAQHRHAAVARRHVRPARRRRAAGLVARLPAPGLSRRARRPTPCSSTSRSPRRWARSGPPYRPTPSTPIACSGRAAATGCWRSSASARRSCSSTHARCSSAGATSRRRGRALVRVQRGVEAVPARAGARLRLDGAALRVAAEEHAADARELARAHDVAVGQAHLGARRQVEPGLQRAVVAERDAEARSWRPAGSARRRRSRSRCRPRACP